VRRVLKVLVVAALALAVLPAAASAQQAVACGAVLTRDTVLTADLVDCPGDGLVVGADGIRITLNGHTITGTGAPGSAGVRNHGHDGVTIEDGDFVGLDISGFQTGILLVGAGRNRVRDLFVEGGSHGIALVRSSGNLLERNAARGGSLNRCDRPDLVAIALFGSNRNLLRDNIAELSDFGISLSGSNRNRIERNQAAPLGSDGNACTGIALFGAHNNAVVDNIADNNVDAGIHVRPRSRGTLVAGNLAERNGDDGIHVDNPETTITANSANLNLDYGIEAVAGVTDGGGNTASGNGNPAQCLNVVCSSP
jgi:parallel beta-helix repeat protein